MNPALIRRGRWFSCTSPRRTRTSDFAAEAYVKLDKNGDVAILRLDSKEKMNTLSREMMTEFQAHFRNVQNDKAVRAIVLISSKSDNFVAGADINMLAACKSKEEISDLSTKGQALFNEVAASPIPVVAAIHGACLGGGLELALSCHYRVATDHKKTALGLPEVMLGLLPGAGGTQRLPRTIGLQPSLDIILTGKQLNANKAYKLGLVDQVVDSLGPGVAAPEVQTRSLLENVAVGAARDIADKKLKIPERPKASKSSIAKLMAWALEDTTSGRNFLFKKAKETVMKQTGGLYPAPLAILEVMKKGYDSGMTAGLELEADKFGDLGMTSEAKALMSLFFGQTALKKNRYAAPKTDVKTVGVLGAGLMGAGIAQVSLTAGYDVVLKDTDLNRIARGEKQVSVFCRV